MFKKLFLVEILAPYSLCLGSSDPGEPIDPTRLAHGSARPGTPIESTDFFASSTPFTLSDSAAAFIGRATRASLQAVKGDLSFSRLKYPKRSKEKQSAEELAHIQEITAALRVYIAQDISWDTFCPEQAIYIIFFAIHKFPAPPNTSVTETEQRDAISVLCKGLSSLNEHDRTHPLRPFYLIALNLVPQNFLAKEPRLVKSVAPFITAESEAEDPEREFALTLLTNTYPALVCSSSGYYTEKPGDKSGHVAKLINDADRITKVPEGLSSEEKMRADLRREGFLGSLAPEWRIYLTGSLD